MAGIGRESWESRCKGSVQESRDSWISRQPSGIFPVWFLTVCFFRVTFVAGRGVLVAAVLALLPAVAPQGHVDALPVAAAELVLAAPDSTAWTKVDMN